MEKVLPKFGFRTVIDHVAEDKAKKGIMLDELSHHAFVSPVDLGIAGPRIAIDSETEELALTWRGLYLIAGVSAGLKGSVAAAYLVIVRQAAFQPSYLDESGLIMKPKSMFCCII